MDVKDAIENRRAFRSLEPVEITEDLINDLARYAQLAPSCFNNQPARFVVVYERGALEKLHAALAKGNEWAKAGSMMIAVCGKMDADCIIKSRKYLLFDLGQAAAFLQLRATELGLVAHPIAGFDEDKVHEVLGIPEEMIVITMIIVGKKADTINPDLSEKQAESEKVRPIRLEQEKYVFRNYYAPEE